VNSSKTAETLEMLFGVASWVGPRNHILGGSRSIHGMRATLGERSGGIL